MEFLAVITLFCWTLCLHTISAAVSRPQLWDDVLAMNRNIELGQSKDAETTRDLHQWWEEFREQKQLFESLFDEKICTAPEELQAIHEKMKNLYEKMKIAWELKQEQLTEIKTIIYHVNYTDTGIADGTGDESVDDACEDMIDYVENTNKTAFEEKEELDEHKEEIDDFTFKMDTHPCPCVWGEWEEWSSCTTTCEAGKTVRERPIAKAAVNNGTECEGESLEEESCNEDVCCPVDCVWEEWADWQDCPSGCGKEKLRTRRELIPATCNGKVCQGPDFEEMPCSRESELEAIVSKLEKDLDQCQATSPYKVVS